MHQQDYILADGMPFGLFNTINTEYSLQGLAPGDNARLVVIYITSTFDQDVTAQAVGQPQGQPSAVQTAKVNIGGSVTIEGNDTDLDAITIRRDTHPHSFYGLTIATGATAPTAGAINVFARVWEEHEPDSAEIQRLTHDQAQLQQALAQMAQTHQQFEAMIGNLVGQSHEHGLIGSLFQRR